MPLILGRGKKKHQISSFQGKGREKGKSEAEGRKSYSSLNKKKKKGGGGGSSFMFMTKRGERDK